MIDFVLDAILAAAFLLGVVTASAFIGLLVLIVVELIREGK